MEARESIDACNKEIRQILNDLIVELGYEGVHLLEMSYGAIDFDLQVPLDFNNCSTNAVRTVLCWLAHGNDSCGHKEFARVKSAGKKAYNKMVKAFYSRGLEKYKDTWGYALGIQHSFKIDKKSMRIIFMADLKIPD